MTSEIVIKAEHISKAYQLGQIGTGTITRDLERFWARTRGKEDPFLKIGEINERTTKSDSNIVWSLKDINFEIKQGDTVGIIGKNGAGKSTLLKILSRVTSPTGGSLKIKGRMASLLEVGTGFHPELTGRENIYLNGSIMGMRKTEITRKFDEIVDFSGVERYVDTPVKRYSSGMYVRLAFAVAAHLESETLLVDEVLAVGDAEFQKKCLGKMGDVSKQEGRTILFVSHNMASIEALCKTGILLNNGTALYSGNIKNVINEYFNKVVNSNAGLNISDYLARQQNKYFHIDQILINGQDTLTINVDQGYVDIEISGESYIAQRLDVEIYLCDANNNPLFFCSLNYTQGAVVDMQRGVCKLKFNVGIPDNLYSGNYNFNMMIARPGLMYLYKIENVYKLNISAGPCRSGKNYTTSDGLGYGYLTVKDIYST